MLLFLGLWVFSPNIAAGRRASARNETQETIAGFVKLTEFQIGGSKFGCILWIAVHPQFRRKGIASTLMTKGIQRLKLDGARAIFASTQRRNVAAL